MSLVPSSLLPVDLTPFATSAAEASIVFFLESSWNYDIAPKTNLYWLKL